MRSSSNSRTPATAKEYRFIAWDCLKLAEATSNPETRASMLDLAKGWVRLAERIERNDQYRLSGYRARAWKCLSLAQSVDDPQRRADLFVLGRMWLSLTEPIPQDLRGAYELPPRLAV